MAKTEKEKGPLQPPRDSKSVKTETKVARAMEIREGASKAREGKPLAFPSWRSRRAIP